MKVVVPFVVTALVLTPALADANRFRKGPYLQSVTPDGITIVFEMAEVTEAVVAFGETADHGKTVTSGRRRLHEVRIDGLEPGTLYHYQVDAGGVRSSDRTFSTAVPASAPFRFLVFGDNRDGHTAYGDVVAAMRADDPDFLVNTGDLVGNGSDEDDWQTFFRIGKRLLAETPLYPVIGNHEIFGGRGRTLFRKYFALPGGSAFPELDYAFTYGNARFVVLTAYERFPREQLDWLRDTLAAALADPEVQHRFVFLHHGPFSSGYHGDNTLALRAGLPRILREGGVDVVFSGHDHDYERGRASGLNYIVTGGGGAPLYDGGPRRPGSAVFFSTFHYVRVDVSGDGVWITTVRPDGAILDRCQTEGAAAWRCEAPQLPDAVEPGTPGSAGPTGQGAPQGCGQATAIAIVLPVIALALVGLYARVRRKRAE